jgi:uncharacterized protein with gpF-like domain
MATKPRITELEDEIIAASVSGVENALASMMDQLVAEYQATQKLGVPSARSSAILTDALMTSWVASVDLGVSEFQNMLTKADTGLSPRSVLNYLRTYGVQQVAKITQTTGKQIRQIVLDGQRQGLTPTEIVKNLINRIPQIARQRAKIIATTEVHSAAQFGLIQSARAAKKLLTKTWITVEDDRVRDFARDSEFSHLQAHGQSAALDGAFRIPRIGGSYEGLLFPGDPNGSPGNIINCRCTMEFTEV